MSEFPSFDDVGSFPLPINIDKERFYNFYWTVYKAFINENWVLMYYHKKKKKYVIPLDKRSKPNLRKGDNKVRIYARDGKGNVSESVYTVIY